MVHQELVERMVQVVLRELAVHQEQAVHQGQVAQVVHQELAVHQVQVEQMVQVVLQELVELQV